MHYALNILRFLRVFLVFQSINLEKVHDYTDPDLSEDYEHEVESDIENYETQDTNKNSSKKITPL